ncbi:hypothetical protein OEA41_002008 [Lepraria neglecta]|uniref:Laccase n=1 Tax=Lepraria neglecta TaxID=209136 RepID=A0AAD9ZE81_9LECA|nr:hypothetical protein OEA41_002008 [Lepraria neglecta]
MRMAEASPKPMLLSDWSHLTSDQYMAAEKATGYDLFCVDSMLINGKGSVNCQSQGTLNQLTSPPLKHLLNGSTVTDRGCTPPTRADLTQGDFTTQDSNLPAGLYSGCTPSNGSIEIIEVDASNGWASINFISAMSLKSPVVSIDEHPMWVYAVDGHYIQPQLADSIFMYNGERYSAMVQLDKVPRDYTIRVANSGADQIISGYATLSYKNGTKNNTSVPYINYGGVNTTAGVIPLDKTILVPFPASAPAPTADATYILNLGRKGANQNWTLNGNATYGLDQDFNAPLLFSPESPDALNPNFTIRTKNNTWIDIILQVELTPATPAQPAHPVHKHSNKAYIIGSANGIFNYTSVAEAMKHMPSGTFNLQTPQLRDSFTTPSVLLGPAWVAFRYQSVNPGAWFLHCHIQTHLDGGMAMTILDGVDAWPDVPAEYGIVNYGP